MWLVILAALFAIIGAILLQAKKIVQRRLGLDDRQVIHPGIAEDKVYEKYNKYLKFSHFFDKYHLLLIGIILVIVNSLIVIFLSLFRVK